MPGLVEALRQREANRQRLISDRQTIASQQPPHDVEQVRAELLELAGAWRQVLADGPMHARPIVLSLLRDRVTFTPRPEPKRWQVEGVGTLAGVFSSEIAPLPFLT